MAGAWLLGAGARDGSPRAVLIAVAPQSPDGSGSAGSPGTETSLRELERLADTDGLTVVDTLVQSRGRPDAATYLGSGKVAEVATAVERVTRADIALHVVDASAPDALSQIATVHDVLCEIGAGQVPEVLALNKIDVAPAETVAVLRSSYPDALLVSAVTGDGVPELRTALAARLREPAGPALDRNR